MASQPNIEFEAAKFLHKLIQDSKDEPDKLAAKLYVILQHMKASGKENSLPYQVISRAMETVVNQHGLDIESLKPPHNPANSESQIRDSSNPQSAGCSQIGGAPQGSKSGLMETDSYRTEAFSSGRPPAGPSSMTNDTYPGSAPNRNAISFDHESPSSVDTRSANSTSYERRDTSNWEQQAAQKDSKRSIAKRKRQEASVKDAHMDDSQQLDAHNTIGDARKGKLMNKMEFPGPFPGSSIEPSASTNLPERSGQGHLLSINQHEMSMGGALSNPDMSLRSGIPRDTGKSPMSSTPESSMPFKEHHLKQLRAQCLVFLAFRNGLMPKRLHLELALGNTLPEEGIGADGVQRDLVDSKGKERTMNEPNSNPHTMTVKAEKVPSVSLFATAGQSETSREEADHGRLTMQKSVPSADPAVNDEERKQILATRRVLEAEMQNQETAGVPAFLPIQSQHDLTRLKSSSNLHNSGDNRHLHAGTINHEPSVMGMNNQPRPEMVKWATIGGQNETSRRPPSSSVAQHDLLARKDSSISPSPSQGFGELAIQGHQYADSNLSVPWKSMQGLNNEKQRLVPAHDAMLLRHGLSGTPSDPSHLLRNHSPFAQMYNTYEPEETDKYSAGVPPPKYTTSEKWIMMQQKRKVMDEANWMKKQKRVDQRIAARFNELKETVSSSEDISAKTRSVIELKKLQLLELQRCLRSNILNDFFKPITVEIDRLKAIKKHRVGRRLKHVEKYEQRMKEERQKRVHERQKEFFSELEFHKERLDDVLKLKKERWRGFNRYVKEFHKRKERVQREKIDRIQREKINLLKINDVEGYLRMVQDAKSDRVKQLLKETEKYLQKLSAKLQEAKSNTKCFDSSTDENQSASVIESNDTATETEDESDQAKHYKESNEKYYLMAHSIKESITEQPAGLRGGKLREYQMNGLRWLVSLYNNHLNGILADEMGLGKTVQVISLICYLMEAKNDRGPFLVVVPSSVLPGWESELNFWAPSVNKIVYAGSPEERRRLFKESIIHQKFNVLLTTYEYLMNKHDRPKLSKVHWHYIIIDEGHRIKNASCKLNADLKHYHSSHRLLLTGTPLQNNLEELWALLNFLLPNIFNSSEDFSQWFNKPFESNGDSSPDETLLSEEENLLIINRLHQVLRPFVLRRLKHKVENQLPEKIERLVRCEASAYQKLLMKRVEENLGSLVNSKARAVHNSVMELRNICNHPYLSQLHVDEVDTLIPKHFLPPIVRLCGKLEMLDRLLPKLKATNHRVLLFSTMTRLLDVMEEYLSLKKYHYVRLDGHTSGMERGALIDQFNRPDSPYFIFLLSIRAGGVGVNLQAADTVIIFDTDWNPQVDLQAQARAHRIGQKKDVLVLRLETVNSVEEQVRASAEHKLGVANQSITAGFFDNNTSAEDRREYLEALLRESKKEEAAPVLNDDGLNDLLARSEPEIDVFESIDQKRREEEMATWKRLTMEMGTDDSQVIPPLPSRLVTDDDLNAFNEAMKRYEVSADGSASDVGMKRKAGSIGAFDTKHYGRGKRAREVRSYEEQWTEEEFEKMCQTESPETLKLKEEQIDSQLRVEASLVPSKTEPLLQIQQPPPPSSGESSAIVKNDVTPPVKRGRGRPRRIPLPTPASVPTPTGPVKPNADIQNVINPVPAITGSSHDHAAVSKDTTSRSDATPSIIPTHSGIQSTSPGLSATVQPVRRRGRKPGRLSSTVYASVPVQDTQPSEQLAKQASVDGGSAATAGLQSPSEQSKLKALQDPCASIAEPSAGSSTPPIVSANAGDVAVEMGPSTVATLLPTNEVSTPSSLENMSGRRQSLRSQSGVEPVRRRGRKPKNAATTVGDPSTLNFNSNESNNNSLASVPQPLKVIAAPPVSVNLGVGSQENASVSLHNVSIGFMPTIPAASQPYSSTVLSSHTRGQNQKGPAGESAPPPPRRRGRKKGSSLAAGSNNLASQDKSPSLSENILKNSEEKGFATTSQGKDVIQSPALVIPDSKPEAQHGVSSKPNELMETASSMDKGAIEANKSDKNVEASNVSLTKEVQMSSPPVEPPCTGSTTVIVLALKASALATHEDARTDVDAERTLSQPEVNIACRTVTTDHLDEDMTAPPGFDNPHAYTTDAAVVGVPLPSEDGKGKEDDAAANKSLTDPVEILEEDSAPPGFGTGDTCTLSTRDASSSEAFEPPPGFGKDALPPSFGVAQAHRTEFGSANIVSSGIGEVLSETGAMQSLGQDQTTTKDNKGQSSREERNESQPTLQTETLDGHLEKCGKEELEDCAIVVQEEKGHGKQETTVCDLSVDRDNESIFSETKNASITMGSEINMGEVDILQKNDDYRGQDDANTDINVDVGPDFAMSEQDIIQKPSLESFSRDGIKTQSDRNIIIDGSREDEDPLKKLQGGTGVHSSCSGAPVILEPEVEQESNNNTNLVGSLAELRQPTAETSTAGHNPTVALHDEKKDGNDEPTDTGIDDCKTYVESSAETRELSEKTVSIIEAVQKDEGSLDIIEHADNVPHIAEPMEQPTESVAAQAEACLSVNTVDLDEGGRVMLSSIKDEVEHIQPVMQTLTDGVSISCTNSVIFDEKQSAEVPDTTLHSVLSSDLSVSASKDEIGGVQSNLHAASTRHDEVFMQIVEESNNVMGTRQNSVEMDEPQEKPSESSGGLNQLEGKSADFGETCMREYSSTEMDTDAHDTVNDTSKFMDICTKLINHSGTADDVASSKPQIQYEEILFSPSVAGNVEKSVQKLEAPSSIFFTCHKDEAHSGKHYDANDPISLHVEASGGALHLDSVSNAEESHGACVGEQVLYCEKMSGNDSSLTEGHIRSSDVGGVLGLASKVDSAEACSEAVAPGDENHSEKSHDKSDDEADMAMALKVEKSEEPNVGDEDEQCKTTNEVGNCSTAFRSDASEARAELADECKEKELQGPDALKEEEQPKNKADDNEYLNASAVCLGAFEAVPASKFEESQGASDVQMKETIAPSSPSETNLEESTCILSETDGQKDEIDSEIGQTAEHETSTGYTSSPQRPTVATQLDSICTSEVPKDETGVSKDEIDSQRPSDVCMTSDNVVQDDQMDPGADCSAAKEKIESPLHDTEMQEIEEKQDASSGPVATQLEVTCTVLGSEIDKDEADPEILPDAEFIVPEKVVVNASNDPEEHESQKLLVIGQSEDPCDTQVSTKEAKPEILLPEEQVQSQEKEVLLDETSREKEVLLDEPSNEGHDINNAKMLLDTDLEAAKAEVDASQTSEDKSEFLEFPIGAEGASDKDSTYEGQENEMNSEKQVNVHAQSSNEAIVRDNMEASSTVTEIEGEMNENPSEVRDKEMGDEKNLTAFEVFDKEIEGEKNEIPAKVPDTEIEGKNNENPSEVPATENEAEKNETPSEVLDKEIEDKMNETTSEVPTTESEGEKNEIPSEVPDTGFEGVKNETSSEVPATEIEGEKNETLSELPSEAGARVIKCEDGSQAEAASTISEMESQKSETAAEAGISKEEVASPVTKDIEQKSEGDAEIQADVNKAFEKTEDEIGAPETLGCEDLSQDQKIGALTAAETVVSEIECQNNEESWKKIIRALLKAAYKVLKTERLKTKYDPSADATNDEFKKKTVKAELEADPMVVETECQKNKDNESADDVGVPKHEVTDCHSSEEQVAPPQTGAQNDETDVEIAAAVDTCNEARKDESDSATLDDVKASVDEENVPKY